MTTPPIIISPALARSTDLDTSHLAAESLDLTRIANMELLILRLLASFPDGATWHELCNSCTIPAQSISPRFKPLRDKELITEHYTDTGLKIVRKGSTNRLQTVWFITDLGRLYTTEPEFP